MAATAVVLLAYYRVASVPEPATPGSTYSWDTVVGETITDVEATVAGLRREYAEQKALYSQDVRRHPGAREEAQLDHQHEQVTNLAA